jgi:hemolysin III
MQNEETAMSARTQTIGEEVANTLSHGLGLAGALAAAPILMRTMAQVGTTADIVGAAVFSTTMVLLYLASSVYHAVPWQRVKALCRRIDHSAIFLMIAGTYTPFTLGVLKGPWGWTLLGVVWLLALSGVVLKAMNRLSRQWVSTALYVAMGWLIVVAAGPLVERVPLEGLSLLGGGGLAYTAGVGFFATDAKLRYGHFVWHIFVVSGTACHFLAVLWYAAAPATAA